MKDFVLRVFAITTLLLTGPLMAQTPAQPGMGQDGVS